MGFHSLYLNSVLISPPLPSPPLLTLPFTRSNFIIYIPFSPSFGVVYQVNQLAWGEKEEDRRGVGEGRGDTRSASFSHPCSNASLLGFQHQPRRRVSAITVN